jgi:hypothetical protein
MSTSAAIAPRTFGEALSQWLPAALSGPVTGRIRRGAVRSRSNLVGAQVMEGHPTRAGATSEPLAALR